MKTTESKTTNTSHLPPAQKATQPFFLKEGEGSFFSKEAPQTDFFFNQKPIQAKLTIGAPNDPYEQEADAMAEKVVQRLAVGSPAVGIPQVQLKCAACGENERLQKLKSSKDALPQIQRQDGGGQPAAPLVPDASSSVPVSPTETTITPSPTTQTDTTAAPAQAPATAAAAPITQPDTTATPAQAPATATVAAAQATQQVQTQTPAALTVLTLTGSVGDGGANAAADVIAMQGRLALFGHLSQLDLQAETAIVQGSQTPVGAWQIQRTMAAMAAFFLSATGRRLLRVEPASVELQFLNSPLPVALGTVNLGGTVGQGGQNNQAEVAAVQARLQVIGFLSAANAQAEAPAAAVPVVPDTALPQTIDAIVRFNREIVGSSLRIIRPGGLEQNRLNNPPRFRTQTFALGTSVGRGQANAPADVTALQSRLNTLGYLSAADFAQEQLPNPPPVTPVADNQIPATLAALDAFQRMMGLAAVNGQVSPGDETHRLLIRPSLPGRQALTLTQPVGDVAVANGNLPAEVRAVQDRLHQLGSLSTADYLAERAEPAAPANIDSANIPRTLAALRSFQQIVTGRNDGRIDVGGQLARALTDPTYGTMTTFNPEATNPDVGVPLAPAQLTAPLTRIITSIEQHEAGGLSGEAPAALRNAVGVPASYGRAQLIGATAVGTIQNNQALRDHYGLDNPTLVDVNTRAANAVTRYDTIYGLVPAGGETAAQLLARIAAFTTQHGTQFIQDTGLPLNDIAFMFHIAQIKRRIIGLGLTRHTDTSVIDTNPDQPPTAAQMVNQGATQLLANADFLPSYNAIQLNRTSLETYIRKTASMGENRASFATKAIFMHPAGQQIRNAMTDASGVPIGEHNIRGKYLQADAAVPATQLNRPRTIAIVTAYSHNRGTAPTAAFASLATISTDSYVTAVMAIWDTL
jgi:hypothetical protein